MKKIKTAWTGMTPKERSVEMKRRQQVAKQRREVKKAEEAAATLLKCDVGKTENSMFSHEQYERDEESKRRGYLSALADVAHDIIEKFRTT